MIPPPGSSDLRPRGVPGGLVAGFGHPSLCAGGIGCSLAPERFREGLTEEDREALREGIDRRVRELRELGVTVTPGPLRRVRSVSARPPAGGETGLDLVLEETDYLEFLATNHDERGRFHRRERERDALFDLEGSPLSNPLTITVYVMTADGRVAIQKRHHARAGHGRFPWQASFAGMFDPSVDMAASGAPDPFRTAVREAREEIGIDLPPDAIRFFGLARESRNFEVSLVGVVAYEGTARDLDRAARLAPDEVLGLELVELSRDGVDRLLRSIGGCEQMVPLAAVALELAVAWWEG